MKLSVVVLQFVDGTGFVTVASSFPADRYIDIKQPDTLSQSFAASYCIHGHVILLMKGRDPHASSLNPVPDFLYSPSNAPRESVGFSAHLEVRGLLLLALGGVCAGAQQAETFGLFSFFSWWHLSWAVLENDLVINVFHFELLIGLLTYRRGTSLNFSAAVGPRKHRGRKVISGPMQ